ncbi:MAG: ornithine cyclodeaminase family protein [Micrococcales bacterium]|nr:ornithine cyclodeaminase family protein [Micrococcales bacterium]
MPSQAIPWIDEDSMSRALPWVEVADALEGALVSGAAPGNTPQRTFVPVTAGEILLMPGEVGPDAGVKVLTIHEQYAALGVPRIQGVHIAFAGDTLTPTAILDGEALTLMRTAGMSAMAVRRLAPPSASSLLVFGTGPQAASHARAINAVRPLEQVIVVGRRPAAIAEVVADLESGGLTARAGSPADVGAVDIVACCTTAAEPLFDSEALRPEATVVAIGSHSPSMREVDTALVRRATVVVESPESALSQAGDIILAIADGVGQADAMSGDLRQLACGEVTVAPDRPRFFKSVGEAWTDIVVSAAIVRAALASGTL